MSDPVTHEPKRRRLRNKGRQKRSVITVNGVVTVHRRWWHSPESGSVAPADAWIDGEQESETPSVREMACRLNNDGTDFDGTAENLLRTAQIKLSGERLRLIVLREGRKVLACQQADAVPVAFHAEDCRVERHQPHSPSRVYTGCDGVMVPLITDAEKRIRREKIRQKRRRCGRKRRPLPPRTAGSDRSFKEFKVVVFYDQHGEHWHEALSADRRQSIGGLIRREARRLNFAQADEKIANVDGASWIRTQLTEKPHELPLDGLGLDFYHLAENVHRCRRRVFGEDDEAGKTWAADLLHAFKHEGWEPAFAALLTWRKTLRNPRKTKAADRLIGYVSERREMINYPEFRERNWQIGSGPTESRCKTTTQRLKGRGRRWDRRNAEAVAALTTLKDSGQWHAYWKTQSGP